MQSTSLRAALLSSLSFGSLLACTAAQQGTAAKPEGAAAPKNQATPGTGKAAPSAPNLAGLPTFLQLVPGGTVELGLDAEQFVNATCQTVSPTKPAFASKMAPAQLETTMRRTVSTLGQRKVDVEQFLLATWNVKCREYEVYVALRRANGVKMRAPFIWWRYGCKEDYEQHLPKIAAAFPRSELGPVDYWLRHGGELPYKMIDEKGNSIAEQPVTYVSWRDANDFAGWLGMRLPTEGEWTRAARGDSDKVWPVGAEQADAYTEELPKRLKIFNSRDRVLKDAGTVAEANGPYGHVDMFGQVWQLVADLGYRPIDTDAFTAEWKKLQRDKVGQLLQAPPAWHADKAIAKGGSYLSMNDPITLMIDARAPMQTVDVLASVGFRLAKSLRPGYDMMYSLLRGSYSRSMFEHEQEVALDGQVGAERYELGADGFPTAYHAVSFAPVNWLSKEKNAELTKLMEGSQKKPLMIGTLATTAPLAGVAVPAGIWSVLYRREGVPRELTEAIKAGHRELTTVNRSKKDDKEGKEGEEKADGDKADKSKSGWRAVIAAYGLTEEDVAKKEAADGSLKFVRLDGLEVPTDRDVFLVHGAKEAADGKVVEAYTAVLPATNAKPAIANAAARSVAIEDDKGKALFKLHFVAPLSQGNSKRVVEFTMPVPLDVPTPAADKPWRLPQ